MLTSIRAPMSRCLLIALSLSYSFFASANIPPVPEMYKLVASEQRVPAKLFYAMILNESRSSANTDFGRATLPWPWTVNHRGKAHFFQSRREAYDFVSILISKQDFQFDVGLGQLNWRWHRHKFLNHWSAFDPYTNLTVSARYLRSQYDKKECGSWERAIGCYHRSRQKPKDIKIAKAYAQRVIKLWKQI